MAGKNEEHSVKLRDTDPAALEDPELVNNVAGLLSEITGESAEDVGAVEVPTPDKDPVEEGDTQGAEEDPAEEGSQAVEDGEAEPTPVDEGDPRPIPEAYYRSAQHSGWDEEAVHELYDQNPDRAIELLQNLHQRDNNLTAQFSELGRKAKAIEEGGTDNTPAVESPAPATGASPIDVESLREKYGDDPIVGIVAQQAADMAAMNENLLKVSKQLDNTRSQVGDQQRQQEADTERVINTFFGDMKHDAYNKFYGVMGDKDVDWTGLSYAQKQNRDTVCVLAGEILDGAKFHGRAMTVNEALDRAHAAVSEPIAESVVRQKIMGEVTKRSKSRVVRPSKSKTTVAPANTGKPRNKQEVEARATERLAALNIGQR